MKRVESLVAILLAFGMIQAFRPESPQSEIRAADCAFCKCSELNGVLVANKSGTEIKFTTGYWYYTRNADGTSGAPTTNAAVRVLYNGTLTCIDNAQSMLSGQMINQHTIESVPDPLPCTPMRALKIGTNMKYDALANPPATTPAQWAQRKCVPAG